MGNNSRKRADLTQIDTLYKQHLRMKRFFGTSENAAGHKWTDIELAFTRIDTRRFAQSSCQLGPTLGFHLDDPKRLGFNGTVDLIVLGSSCGTVKDRQRK